MHPKSTLFYDVDTQRDFMLPGGKLYVPGAEKIVPQLQQLTACARRRGIVLAGSVDRHSSTDPELQANGGEYPEHCMDGTEGQEKVEATAPRHPLWIEDRMYVETALRDVLSQEGEVYIEKRRFDVFTGNRNAPRVFDLLLHGKDDVVVYGVVTEVCVDHAIARLRNVPGRPVRLHVPVDAIAALNAERGQATLDKWRRWGVRLTTTAQLCEELEAAAHGGAC
jgi:nicotinamidase/pyrazinamidase